MPAKLFRLYQRKKIININVNIIVAGMLAIAIAAWPVHVVSVWLEGMLGRRVTWADSLIAALIDGAADVTIYFLLHWVANHWRPLKPISEADQRDQERERESFWKTATFIQAERYLLSPIFYTISMGGMWLIQVHTSTARVWAFVISFATAILITRTIHTLWGLRTGRFR